MVIVYGLALLILCSRCFVSASTDKQKNVLLIIIDDFRPEIQHIYTHSDDSLNKDIITPNINALAKDSMVFTQAYSQYPSCGPSRASFLTGRRPDTTQVFKNEHDFRDTLGKHIVTMPQYFKENDYKVYGAGKVFHTGQADNQYSWTEDFFEAKDGTPYWQTITFNKASWGEAGNATTIKKPLTDQQTFYYINNKLHTIGENDKFFMVAGFKKPHLPFICPKPFFDKYPIDKIKLPTNPHVPTNFNEIGWNGWLDLFNFTDMKHYDKSYNHTTSNIDTLNLRRAYYACTSYVDDLVGKLLTTLKEKRLDSNTVVALVSDHGFHLGEHSTWTKGTLFNLDLRIPMIIKVPGETDNRRKMKTNKFVELIDLFPTLVDAAKLNPVPQCKDSKTEKLCAEGTSAYRLIKDPSENGKQFVLGQYRKRSEMGYSIKDQNYHYICWLPVRSDVPIWDKCEVEELYDVKNDPNENHNMAFDSKRDIMDSLKDKMEKGYKEGLPLPKGSMFKANIDVALDDEISLDETREKNETREKKRGKLAKKAKKKVKNTRANTSVKKRT